MKSLFQKMRENRHKMEVQKMIRDQYRVAKRIQGIGAARQSSGAEWGYATSMESQERQDVKNQRMAALVRAAELK